MKLKKASIFTKIVILALILYAGVSLSGTKDRIARAETERAQLQEQVDAALQENAELRYDIEHAGDPETIAEIARTKLGLVMPGEKIFYDVSN
ncbi:MAG: septum formation initiator family protein [Oscillospiraceae bacterium]